MIKEGDKIIFLDIDGVLNNDKTLARTPQGFVGINSTLTSRLKNIVKETKAKIVLSSSWRVNYVKYYISDTDSKYLIKQLGYKDLKIEGSTTITGSNRGWQIKQYIEEHKIKTFVILDDEFENEFAEYNLTKHLVHTDSRLGLTRENVEQAIKILQN